MRYTENEWRGMVRTLVDQLDQCSRLVSDNDKEFWEALDEAGDMLAAPPLPFKKLPTFKADKDYVYRTVGKRQGNIREVIVAHCVVGGNGRAQAYRNARLFAAAPRLLDVARTALQASEDADDDELADELRVAIAAAEGK